MSEKRIIKIIPSEDILIENKPKPCTQTGCTSTFKTLSNLHMHLEKHHKIKINNAVDKNAEIHYYCPIEKCKYLRQHFLKVHAKKSIKCVKCSKTFANETLKAQHEKCCGETFECPDCHWKYSSRESLLTHCRRKKHSLPLKGVEYSKPEPKAKAEIAIVKRSHGNAPLQTHSGHVRLAPKIPAIDMTNQSNLLMKRVKLTLRAPAARIKDNFAKALSKVRHKNELKKSLLTKVRKPTSAVRPPVPHAPKSDDKYKSLELIDEESNSSAGNPNEASRNLNNLSYIGDDSNLHYFTVSNFNAGLCHIETQTEMFPFDESNINSSEMDPLLCHMHTQTSDDILTELGLSNIQTQTNWSNEVCNDLFVSAETQTCFETHLSMDNSSTQTQTFNAVSVQQEAQWSDDMRRHQSQFTQTYFE